MQGSQQAVGCHILSLSVVDTDTEPGVQGRGGGGWRRWGGKNAYRGVVIGERGGGCGVLG